MRAAIDCIITDAMDIYTEIEIAAPIADVWRTLTDFSAYSAWNPVMPNISGTARSGERIRIWLAAGALRVPLDAEVISVEPERELCWIGPPISQLRPLVSGRHYFRLHDNGDGTVHLAHGEVFAGWLIPRGWNLGRGTLERAYNTFNQALKRHVEG